MKTALLVLWMILAAGPLSAQGKEAGPAAAPAPQPAFVLPPEVRAGEALIVWLPRAKAGEAFCGEAVLVSPEGGDLRKGAAFPVPAGPAAAWDACALALPMDASVGTYRVELRGTRGGRPCFPSRTIEVRSREYLSENIPLSSGLTTLREEPTQRKEEEARAYFEILGRTDPLGIWLDGPFRRPVASDRRTSFFGDRRRYVYATGGTSDSVHLGIDFGIPRGTPVSAAGRGRVVFAADRQVTGKTVILEHLPGIYTIYMHLDSLAVAPGAVVERGGALGTSGATGLATGPHLHWELRVNGEACDPESPSLGSLFPGGLSRPAGIPGPGGAFAPTP